MEELITLHHGNFAILGRWVKEFAQKMGCLNQVADWALQSQLFLDEMKKECTGWNTASRQDWSLILLEQIFHNAAPMWHSVRGAPGDSPWNQLRQPLNTIVCRPLKGPGNPTSCKSQRRYIRAST